MSPSSPSLVKTSRGKSCFSSHSREWGASSVSAKWRTVFLRCCCSSPSLRPNGTPRAAAGQSLGRGDNCTISPLRELEVENMENRCPECGTTLHRCVPAWAHQLTVAYAMTKDPVNLGHEDSMMKA